MQFYFRESKAGITPLFYDVTDVQLEHIVTHQYKSFPARFFTKKMFCPMLSQHYARRVGEERSNWLESKTKHVHVLRFFVHSKFISKYARGKLDNKHTPICVPVGDLIKLNQKIVGYIERVDTVDLTEFYQSTGINV